jgi:hypothetical protein
MKKNLPNEYLEFIEECKMKDYGELFTHRHHILPKFMGGDDSDNNLIVLSVEDHFMAHKILAENCEDGYKPGAVASLNVLLKYWIVTDDGEHNIIRKLISDGLSGDKNGMYGKSHSTETLKKLSEYTKMNNPMNNPESVEKVRLSKLGKPRVDMIGHMNPVYKDGVVDKIKNSIKEFYSTTEGYELRKRLSDLTKLNHPMKSEESRKKMKASLKVRWDNLTDVKKKEQMNSINKRITCDICGKTTNIGNFTRWHVNKKCK